MAKSIKLLEGDVSTVLRKQSTPMAVGVVFVILVNLIDTYWAGQLGTDELAAMSFAFPVIGVIINVSLGLMIGTSIAVARVVGAGDQAQARRIATHSLLLGVLIVGLVTGVGLATQDLIFGALGAEPRLLEVISSYMRIWYLGAIFLVVPMMLNGVLRAHGDPLTPRNMMILAAVLNGILDPLFIFGAGPVPAMGLEGAAWATVLSRALTFLYAGWTAVKLGTLELHLPTPPQLIRSWKTILQVGIPATITNVLGPIATAILTAIVAGFGAAAVAAYGIGARVEALVLIAPIALSSGLSPFVGQNWGAHLPERVAEGFRVAVRFSILWGLGALLILVPTAPWIAAVFSNEPQVQAHIVTYLRIAPVGYAAYSVMMMVSSVFNAMDHAVRSTVLSAVRSIFLAIPLAWAGSLLLGIPGIFLGLVIASLVTSLLGLRWMKMFLDPDATVRVETADLDDGAAVLAACSPDLRDSVAALLAHVGALEGIELHRVHNDAVGFFVGARQLGHLHASGHLDLSLPLELGEALVAQGKIEHHRLHHEASWFTHPFHDTQEVSEAEWMLRLAHALNALRLEGPLAKKAHRSLGSLALAPEAERAVQTARGRWSS
jgi:putative MATE family efflux protein